MKIIPTRPSLTAGTLIRGISLVTLSCFGLSLAASSADSQESPESTETLQTSGKKAHRKPQKRPIKLGSSGGNVKDLTALECCDGTLGALVEKKGVQYILSNNHVLARSNKAKIGEAIIQPGLGDQRPVCEPQNSDADTVAFLSARKRVKFGPNKTNKVDVAIAEVVPGTVKPTGEIIGIGVPGSTPVEAKVGMKVKKSGRTTAVTRGSVIAVNATALVEFPTKCGSEQVREAQFKDLIFITGNNGGPFIRGGDSGSMVYENKKTCPAPVGLIFAGSEEITAASPAATVQKIVSKIGPKGEMRFVGCQQSSAAETTIASSSTSSDAATDSAYLSGSSRDHRAVVDERQIEQATRAMRIWEADLLETRGVHSFGVGISLEGPIEPAIYVFADEDQEQVRERLPEDINGFPVEVFKAPRLVAF